MSDQGRSNQGRFLSKSEENRQVRSMRLTDYVWQKLGEIASFKNLTRADLLEEFVRSGALDLNLGGKVMEHKLETDGLQNDDQECVVRLSRKTMYKVDKAADLRSITRNELIENFINSGVFEQKTKFDSSTRMTVTKFAKFIGVAPKTVR
ncbi:MAG: hypothetical protein F6K23_39075, partial [Okeania sp. SIO2C9]|uniref:hypothetical protein n=1 Tax=Okeania sp. SIO2C9 TaxID=2607791 RepID=UPI0013BEF554